MRDFLKQGKQKGFFPIILLSKLLINLSVFTDRRNLQGIICKANINVTL